MGQVDRNANRSFNGFDNKIENDRQKETYEKDKQKYIQEWIEKLKTNLELDDLQHIAISQIINETVRTEAIIRKKEDSDENKIKAINALTETTETKIKALLSPTQIEKYDAVKNTLHEKKKSKKKK